jgi:unsaturated rhamnogalacturonyl hydrolase
MLDMRRLGLFIPLLLVAVCSTAAQTKPISEQVAATAMNALWRDAAKNESGYPARWTYDHGLVLKGIERVWGQHARQTVSRLHSTQHGPLRQ